jgi:hypothetical protein
MTPIIEFLRHGLAFLWDEEAFGRLEHIPGFWSAFGFLACTLIILLSKLFGHAGIMKPEDYYDE